MAHYEFGSEVKVYYNQHNPKEAVLETRVSKPKLGLIVPIVLTVVEALLLLTIITVLLWIAISG